MSAHYGPVMSLGDHLEELRWRLLRVVIVVVVIFFVAFAYSADLKLLIIQPLRWALDMFTAEQLAEYGLPAHGAMRLLRADNLAEPAVTSMQVAFYTALAAAVPHILLELWGFVSPGLKPAERKLGFLFVPAALLFFYGGMVIGFCYGLPWLYRFLIEWGAADPTAGQEFRQSIYLNFFVLMTLAFGAIMDIPWGVMVMVRVGLVSCAQLSRARKFVILAAAMLAAVLTPPDPVSQILVLVPMLLLFELGLLGARLLERSQRRRSMRA